MPEILEVTEVETALTKNRPPWVIVRAAGNTSTLGWTHPSLDMVLSLVPPEDGIQELTFDADQPQGEAGQMITPISAKTSFEKPEWLKGVRVVAKSNAIDKGV